MTDFFDLPEESFSKQRIGGGKKVDPNVYDPDPNAYNGSYKSVFRFIPYVFDKSKTKYTKYTAKFWNPLTKESLIVDCPSNVDKPSIIWTMDSVIRSIKKEEPELHKEMTDLFSRWSTNHSAIYIKKDPQRPDLEGSIKIFKFRNQIDMLIDQIVNPEELDGLSTSKKVNPYHLLEGKDLLCVVGKKTKDFRDWSKCKFMDEVTPLVFKVGETLVQVKNDEKSVKLVSEFLTNNTPKMDEYFHQDWTDETFEKVATAIVATVQHKEILEMILQKSKDTKMNELIRSKMTSIKSVRVSAAPVNDELDFKSATPKSEPASATSVNELVSSDDSDDEYDSLFKDL